MNGIDVFITRNGKTEAFSASCILHDKTNDIAILKINDSRFKTMPSIPYSLGAGTKDVGSKVFAMGYPELSSLGEEIKVTDGIISSKTGYQGDATTYQISAPIQHGNSGGPLFDNSGSVIGITNAGVESLQNVGYAIKISYLKMLVEDSPERINLPSSNQIASLSFTEKIKKISPYVVIIKTYYSASSTSSSRTQVITTSPGSQRQSTQRETTPTRSAVQKKSINGHDFVDLGLSVMWSTCNVGASKPEELGLVLAWGEIDTKSSFTIDNYKFCNRGKDHEIYNKYYLDTGLDKYNQEPYGIVDNKTKLDLSDDAARLNWGGSARIPTNEEIKELREKCSWTLTKRNGIDGYMVTSSINGNSIFLPIKESGGYWSSSLSKKLPQQAFGIVLESDIITITTLLRYSGNLIRPVVDY